MKVGICVPALALVWKHQQRLALGSTSGCERFLTTTGGPFCTRWRTSTARRPFPSASHLELDATPAELHHRHLPMLAEQEFVSWNADSLVVARGRQFHEVVPLLDRLEPTLDG